MSGRGGGYAAGMTEQPQNHETENVGRIDDAEEEREPTSTTDGAAADGDYDPAQGSPAGAHPTGEDFPEEATRYDDPEHRRP